MINGAHCSSLLQVVKREMKMKCRWDLQNVWMTGHLLGCREHHGTESFGPQLWFRQTTLPDGETRIMIRLWVCLSVMPLNLLALLSWVRSSSGHVGVVKYVCAFVCACHSCLGMWMEYELNGCVYMCVCVCLCACDRGPHRLQMLMSVSSQLGNPVIVTLLK